MMGKMELASSSIGTNLRDFGFSLLHKSGQFGGVFTNIWKQNAEDAAKGMQ